MNNTLEKMWKEPVAWRMGKKEENGQSGRIRSFRI
jgi:hypothetical protein